MHQKNEEKARLKKISGINANNSGLQGEKMIEGLLPSLVHINKPGADFMTPDGKRFIEVKTVFSNSYAPERIMLKTLNKSWMNEIADTVIIVTRSHIFFGKADALRGFVKAQYKNFRKIRISKDRRERVLVPVVELEKIKIIQGIERKKITRENFNLSVVLGKKPKARVFGGPKNLSEIRKIIENGKAIAATRAALSKKPGQFFKKNCTINHSNRRIFSRKTFPR